MARRESLTTDELYIGTDQYVSPIRGLYKFATLLSPVLVAANTTAEQLLTVPGLKVGDIILSINKPTAQAGLGIVGARVSAANTLAVTFVNDTAGGLTPTAAETYQIVAATF